MIEKNKGATLADDPHRITARSNMNIVCFGMKINSDFSFHYE